MVGLEPAELIWLGLLAAGITASGVLIQKGRKPLTAVASEHPLMIGYFVGHFAGIWPKSLDPISLAHRAMLGPR